jgi:hypothetical protein
MNNKRMSELRNAQDRLLDDALADTFPASDPVSNQQIVIIGGVRRRAPAKVSGELVTGSRATTPSLCNSESDLVSS